MSTYIPVDLQRQIRTYFSNCCAYCRTAESLTAVTYEFEHIIPRSAATEIIGLTPTGRATTIALKMNRPQLTRVRRIWVKLGMHPPNFG